MLSQWCVCQLHEVEVSAQIRLGRKGNPVELKTNQQMLASFRHDDWSALIAAKTVSLGKVNAMKCKGYMRYGGCMRVRS
jgi:hypothetical protein